MKKLPLVPYLCLQRMEQNFVGIGEIIIIELPQAQDEEQNTQMETDQSSEPQTHPQPRRSHRIPVPRVHFAPYIKH